MKQVVVIGNQAFSLVNFRGALIKDLVERGHQVHALAPDIDGAAAAALEALGAKPVEIAMSRTGTNPFADLRTLLSLRKVLATIRPDVTLSYAAKPNIYGTLAAWLARVPRRFAMVEGLGYVFIPRATDGFARRALRRLVITLFRVALRRADKVFFLNRDDVADFAALGLIRADQVVNIGGIGVDLAEWAPAEPVVAPTTFAMVARLLRDKGVLEFVAAARQVKARHPQSRFLLIGGLDDNPESISHREVEVWVADGVVEWTGHVPVRFWLQQTSVFVLPSYREGLPRSTQEAMAMGLPVITTDVPGCRDTVEDSDNGYLVPPRDAAGLAAAMVRFIDDPSLVARMGARSRQIAEARFDVRKVNAHMIETMGL